MAPPIDAFVIYDWGRAASSPSSFRVIPLPATDRARDCCGDRRDLGTRLRRAVRARLRHRVLGVRVPRTSLRSLRPWRDVSLTRARRNSRARGDESVARDARLLPYFARYDRGQLNGDLFLNRDRLVRDRLRNSLSGVGPQTPLVELRSEPGGAAGQSINERRQPRIVVV